MSDKANLMEASTQEERPSKLASRARKNRSQRGIVSNIRVNCSLARIFLPPPAMLAQKIVEQVEVALEEFRSVEEVLATNGDNE